MIEMTMPKGWAAPKKVELTEYEIEEQKRKSALFESQNKAKWKAIEQELKQRKKADGWLDYYDSEKLWEAKVRRWTRNYSGYIALGRSSSNNGSSIQISENTKDNLVIGGGIAFLLSAILAIVLGAYFVNWIPVIYGLAIIGAFMAIGFSGGNNEHDGLYAAAYYWRASRGRSFRMWAANRRT